MRRCTAAAVVLLALLTSCVRFVDDAATPEPTVAVTAAPLATPVRVDPAELKAAVLSIDDVGDGWKEVPDAQPNTVQIGGKVGAANIQGVRASATSAFGQVGGKGFITNTVLLMPDAASAAFVMRVHRESTGATHWEQPRTGGGRNTFDLTELAPADLALPGLGDEVFAARLKVTIIEASGASTERQVAYVVYRVGPLLGFVLGQDTDAAEPARQQSDKVNALVA